MLNAGVWEHLFKHAKVALDRRSDEAAPLCSFSLADIQEACSAVPRIIPTAAPAGGV
jgi:hypothetical protein